MKLYVNVAKSDWQLSWQHSVVSSADIRHSGVTKMPDVIQNYIHYIIFEKNTLVFYPTVHLAPHYPIYNFFSSKNMHLKIASAKFQQYCSGFHVLTHWGRDKMATIFQTTFSNTFSWMKMFDFCSRFHWTLFLGFQLIKSQHWFR